MGDGSGESRETGGYRRNQMRDNDLEQNGRRGMGIVLKVEPTEFSEGR